MSWLPIESEYSKNVAYSVFMNQYINADHLLIINDQNNARQALMDQHALKVLTNNDEAKTLYMGKNSFNIFDKKTVKSGALIILLQ